ncbi:MAG: hypothetical protein LKCHEGNO_01982 [Burkholderiaceae bacterium]|nr:hypothetical protein [Burkholderiaceae bacterium]
MLSFAGRFARFAAPLGACLLAACAATGPAGPQATAPPTSSFGPALRCMDGLLLDHGVRDVSVSIESAEPSQRNARHDAGGMLIAAISDMTQRSRAIRLVAADAQAGAAAQAPLRATYAVAPQYTLRGALRGVDGGGTVGIDLALLLTQDMSVVPGSATHGAALLRNGRAEFALLRQPFAVPAASVAQAQRALSELAAIELFGRFVKVPYWSCLGIAAENPAVTAEIQDWYDAMAARPAELVGYFQQQLRIRQAYDGPIDGTVSPAFKDAVVRTRGALGLSREPKLSLELFRAYLGADLAALQARVRTAAPALASAAAAPAAPLTLQLTSSAEGRRLARGEAVQLSIRPSRDAHVYCYLQDEKRQVTRFFPNRFRRDSRVAPTAGLQLPGSMRFELIMNPRGVAETVTCFATERDVLAELPPGVNGGDFQPLPAPATLDQVRQAFVKASGGALALDSIELRSR